jgi:two-component system sensor histidine kinase YesM
LHPFSFQRKLLLSYVVILIVPVSSALLIYGVNLYNQTKDYYEQVLVQLNNRTNVIVNDFVSNIARVTFFYLTDTKLQEIVGKSYMQSGKEYVADFLYVQKAMDQFVLMNGNISGITLLAPNRRIYNSTAAYEQDMMPMIDELKQADRRKERIVVSAPYESRTWGNGDKLVSILRYLSDLNANEKETYVKVDIKFRALENIFGGIEDANGELGTIVIADGKVIYHSRYPYGAPSDQDMRAIIDRFDKEVHSEKKTAQLNMKIDNESFLFSSVMNELTGWKIVQYIPTRVIDRTFLINTRNYILLSLVSLVAAFFLGFFLSKRFIKPINKLNRAIKLVDSENLDRVPLAEKRNDEIGWLIDNYNAMIKRLKESREMEIVSSQLQKRAELNMLQAQINPHFLYNTLNAIYSIAELQRSEEIAVMARSLSSMYRYNIKSGDEVTIQNELEQIKNYVTIQQIRFLGKFDVRYEVDEELYSYKILKFLLQPLVENSFYHGLEPKGGKGNLLLSIVRKWTVLHIRIEDDGVGLDEQKLAELNRMFETSGQALTADSKQHFALYNVYARIKHFYGNAYGMKITSRVNEGTCVEITIPAIKEMNPVEHFGGR